MMSAILVFLFSFPSPAQEKIKTYEFQFSQIANAEIGKERIGQINALILSVVLGRVKAPANALPDLFQSRTDACKRHRDFCLNIGFIRYWLCEGNIDGARFSKVTDHLFSIAASQAEAGRVYEQIRSCSQSHKASRLQAQLISILSIEKKWSPLAASELSRLTQDWKVPSVEETIRIVGTLNKVTDELLKLRPIPVADLVRLLDWSLSPAGMNLRERLIQVPTGDAKTWISNALDSLKIQASFVELKELLLTLDLKQISKGSVPWIISVNSYLCGSLALSGQEGECTKRWASIEADKSLGLTPTDKNWINVEKAWTLYQVGKLAESKLEFESVAKGLKDYRDLMNLLIGFVVQAQGNARDAKLLYEAALKSVARLPPWVKQYAWTKSVSADLELRNLKGAESEIIRLRKEFLSLYSGTNEFSAWVEFHNLTLAVLKGEPPTNLAAKLKTLESAVGSAAGLMPIFKMGRALQLARIGGNYQAEMKSVEKDWGSQHPELSRLRRLISSLTAKPD